MANKGMSQTLYIIIAAVVILVAALIILTILGTGLTPVASLADARANCGVTGKSLCETTGSLPFNWNSPAYNINGRIQSCAELCGAEPCNYVNKEWTSAVC